MSRTSAVTQWLRPKLAIQHLLKSPSLTRIHFYMLAGVSFALVLQLALFFSSIQELRPFPFSSAELSRTIAIGYLFVFAASYGVLQLITLLFWKIARSFSGKGGLKETRLALTWWLVCTAPLGFLFLIFVFSLDHPALMQYGFFHLALFAVPVIVFYGLAVLLRGIAEAHQLSLWRSLIVCLLSGLTLFVILYLITIGLNTL